MLRMAAKREPGLAQSVSCSRGSAARISSCALHRSLGDTHALSPNKLFVQRPQIGGQTYALERRHASRHMGRHANGNSRARRACYASSGKEEGVSPVSLQSAAGDQRARDKSITR